MTPSRRLPSEKLDARLFLAAVALCAATRLVALEEFPIYFFTDEAANTVMAAEFVQNGWRDSSGELFPTYFANNGKLSLSLSVYAQVIPAWLFGRSVPATRATAALIALSGTMAAGLILRQAFGLRRAWLSPTCGFRPPTPATCASVSGWWTRIWSGRTWGPRRRQPALWRSTPRGSAPSTGMRRTTGWISSATA